MDVVQVNLKGSQSSGNPNDFELILISFSHAQDQTGTLCGADLKEDWADVSLRGRRASQIELQVKTRVEAEESILEAVRSLTGSVAAERSG